MPEKQETIDLRMTFKGGKLMEVQPISCEGCEYEVESLKDDLNGQRIRNIAAFAINQESPVCLYWYVYKVGGHWEKICLKWSD